MATIVLTEEQLAKIKQDMLIQTEMLTDEQVLALAEKVNNKIDLPYLGEQKELVVIVKIIKWIDRELYKMLPNEYYELIHDTHDGIDKEEIEKIKNRVIPLINKIVNIPIIPEFLEESILRLVIDLILGALQVNVTLDRNKVVKITDLP